MEQEEQRFARFVADLALDSRKLDQYQKDREAAMEAAGLDDEERAVLRTDNFKIICDYMEATGARPGATWIQGGPPGSGTGTGEPGG